MTTTDTLRVGPPPPHDPECAAALAGLPQFLPLTLETVPVMRAAADQYMPRPTNEELTREGAYAVEERAVPGPAGAPDVALIVCRPTDADGPVPALFNVHGGGMVGGDARDALGEMLDLAGTVGAALVSVAYRLAPETPHPGPVEDCYAGLVWVSEHAAELGIDPTGLVVAGNSAGAGLAAAVALMARDRSGPALAGQLLVYPMLDDRNDSPSAHQMAAGRMWPRSDNEVGWTALLGEARGGPDVSPYAAPARAEDLAGLPPAYIDVGSADTFRDEDVGYASRIWQAGGVAELHVWPGAYHGFEGIAPHAAISRAAWAARTDWLRRLLTS
jgi:acetyl esterase/lipase